jgi:hypothetical protein
MKFINYLTSISGVSIYPMISLGIFVIFFTLLIIYTLKSDKQHIIELKNLPLENKNP